MSLMLAGVQVHNSGKQHGPVSHYAKMMEYVALWKAASDTTEIWVNKALSTVTGHAVTLLKRLDVVRRVADGKFEALQVLSPGQRYQEVAAECDALAKYLLEKVGILVEIIIKKP